MLWGMKRLACVGVALFLFLLSCLMLYSVQTVKIRLDDPALRFLSREFYLDSSSSQAQIKKDLAWFEWSKIEGESVEYAILERERSDSLAFARQKCKALGGTELFVEDVNGTISIYAFAPKLYEGIELYGKRVNLHVAVRGDRLVVGSPIVFGGF